MDRTTLDVLTTAGVSALAVLAVACFAYDLVRRERTGVGVLAWSVVGGVLTIGLLGLVAYRFVALAS